MPQMFPSNWMSLFIYFLIIFLTFNIFSYYTFSLNLKNKKLNLNLNKKTNSNFWKW